MSLRNFGVLGALEYLDTWALWSSWLDSISLAMVELLSRTGRSCGNGASCPPFQSREGVSGAALTECLLIVFRKTVCSTRMCSSLYSDPESLPLGCLVLAYAGRKEAATPILRNSGTDCMVQMVKLWTGGRLPRASSLQRTNHRYIGEGREPSDPPKKEAGRAGTFRNGSLLFPALLLALLLHPLRQRR